MIGCAYARSIKSRQAVDRHVQVICLKSCSQRMTQSVGQAAMQTATSCPVTRSASILCLICNVRMLQLHLILLQTFTSTLSDKLKCTHYGHCNPRPCHNWFTSKVSSTCTTHIHSATQPKVPPTALVHIRLQHCTPTSRVRTKAGFPQYDIHLGVVLCSLAKGAELCTTVVGFQYPRLCSRLHALILLWPTQPL